MPPPQRRVQIEPADEQSLTPKVPGGAMLCAQAVQSSSLLQKWLVGSQGPASAPVSSPTSPAGPLSSVWLVEQEQPASQPATTVTSSDFT